jgi:nucleotide-binding universal stress UspA family protein
VPSRRTAPGPTRYREQLDMYKKILVPTDGSDIAQAVGAAAVEFARACGSELLVLSVARPTYLMPADESTMTSDPGFGVEALMRHADENVQQIAQLAKAGGVPCNTLTILSDAPSDEILDAADREQCDLIVMGSHGRHGWWRLLASSEMEQVVENAHVPVMVLRPEPPAPAR